MLVAIATVACRITNNSARLPLRSFVLASAGVTNYQSVSVHSQGPRQLIASRTRASPQSRVPFRFGAADGLSACINACACRPCSRPWSFTTTAAASWAAGGSTGGAAGKPSKVDRWSSSMDSRRGCNTGEPPNHSRNSARNSAADRPDAGAVQNRNTHDINEDLRASTSVAQLQQILQQDGPAMTYVNLTASILTLKRILNKHTGQQQQQVTQTAISLFNQLWQLQRSKLPQCGVRELPSMTYSVCLLPTPLQQHYQWVITQHLLPAFMQRLSSAGPKHVSNVLYGMAASGQQLLQQTAELLINQLVAVLPKANTQDIANSLWAVATMQQQIQPIQLQQLIDAFCAVAQIAKPQEIKDTLWAVATMQQQVQPAQLQQLLDAFCAVAQIAKPQEIKDTLWAVASMQQQVQPAQLQQLLDAFCAVAQKAKPQEIANTLWAVATMQQRVQPRQLQQLLDAFCAVAQTARPQEIKDTLWAVATMKQQVGQGHLDQMLGACAVAQKAKPQHFANTLWAVVKMQQQIQPTQLQQLLDAFCAVAQTAKPQEIKDTLWAVATMQQQVQPMQLHQLLDAFCAVAKKAKPQEIANTLWAVATMKQHVEQVEQLDQMLGALLMQLGDAVPQDVSNTLLACAEFRYLPKLLMIAPALIDKLDAANPQELANTAWACGKLGHRDERLMSTLLNRVVGLVDTSTSHLDSRGVTAQTLANLCWSLAVLDMRQHALDVLTLVQAGKPFWASMVPEAMSQLYQVHMWLTDHSLAGGQGLATVLTAQQLQQCQSTWQQQLGRTAASESGPFHQSVCRALQRILDNWLVPPAMEQVSLGADGQPDGAALIDITARTADGVWLAVEADGPWHFRRPDRGLMGTTLYRNRALAVRRYVLISVPYYEWHNIQHSDRSKQQYLLDKITAALQQAATSKHRQ